MSQARAAALRSLIASQGRSRAGMPHGARRTSSAQLRYMRMLAIEHRTDVGPACCAFHSAEWIDGLKISVSEGLRLTKTKRSP